MGSFFAELRRRHIYRIGAGYVIAAWAVVQVLDVLSQLWALPDWIAQPITIVLAIGLPITLIVAWLIEGNAQEAVASAVRSPATATDWILASALAAVLAFMAYERFAPAQPEVTEIETAVPTDGISIAVLPFTNLSSDPEQEFFSDGMTEEITAALAKVQDLRVVGRTSAFQFKGQNEDLRAIGEALGASHLIEGLVRKDGNELRITAQLISASDGSHLWAESYDRELTGVFAVQEEIAQAIAGALRVPLGLAEGGQLVANRTGDLESYEQFLRARALYLSREIAESITVLESITARDPDFAPAWALLAQAHIQARNYDTTYGANGRFDDVVQLFRLTYQKAQAAAEEALRHDPRNALAYAVLGQLANGEGRWTEADDYFRQALELDPNDPNILLRYGLGHLSLTRGRFREAAAVIDRIKTLEPFVPAYDILGSWVKFYDGQHLEALAMIEATPEDALDLYRNFLLAIYYAEEQRYDDAADTLLAIDPVQNLVSRQTVEQTAELLRSLAQGRAQIELPASLDFMSIFYVYADAPERYLDRMERVREAGYTNAQLPWFPSQAPIRNSERFKTYVHEIGLYDYWREHGWPDLCRPVGSDDFECD